MTKKKARVDASPAGQSPVGSTAPADRGPRRREVWSVSERLHLNGAPLAGHVEINIKGHGSRHWAAVAVFGDIHESAQSRADFICRAANSHRDMLAALKAVRDLMREAVVLVDTGDDPSDTDTGLAVLDQVKAAIQKAEASHVD